LKNSILIGIMISFVFLLSSLDMALAEKENAAMPVNMAMQDNMTVQDNMTMPQKMSMPMSMPMDMPMNMPMAMSMPMSMPMNETKMPNGGTNVIILQNVTLNIITILNMTFPNAIQP
jgi:hypothetical protein